MFSQPFAGMYGFLQSEWQLLCPNQGSNLWTKWDKYFLLLTKWSFCFWSYVPIRLNLSKWKEVFRILFFTNNCNMLRIKVLKCVIIMQMNKFYLILKCKIQLTLLRFGLIPKKFSRFFKIDFRGVNCILLHSKFWP